MAEDPCLCANPRQGSFPLDSGVSGDNGRLGSDAQSAVGILGRETKVEVCELAALGVAGRLPPLVPAAWSRVPSKEALSSREAGREMDLGAEGRFLFPEVQEEGGSDASVFPS